MKSEFVDVTETRKNLVIEIPAARVEEEIDRHARAVGREARVPGFRPGKVPMRVIRQRYRDHLLHETAEHLIPRAVEDALRERGVEPISTPEIHDVAISEGQPLRFTASVETVPPIEPGPYEAITLRRVRPPVEEADVDRVVEQMRQRAARLEPVQGRAAESGDTLVVDLSRQMVGPGDPGEVERHENVTVELGAAVNPPGFDDELIGVDEGGSKTFTVQYPADYAISELAGSSVRFEVTLKGIRRRVVPSLDDEFARDVGDFDTLDALRARVREDLERAAEDEASGRLRDDLLRAVGQWVTFEPPDLLVERELDRRVEEFLRRLVAQRVDPRRAGIDWEEFRRGQRASAAAWVKSALALDEVARREGLVVVDEDIDREVARHAARTGRTAAAVRADLEQEGARARLTTGLRREKAVDFLMARATIAED
jgi:trigger factor